MQTALRTYSGLSPKHAEKIGAGEEDEAVKDVYGNDSLTTANTASSVENVKGIPEVGSQLPVSPPELWGPAVWEEWYNSIEQILMETEQERALRILNEPRKGPIGLSLVDAYCLHYIDNFLTTEAVLHIRLTVSQHLMDRNKRKINQSKRRRNIVSPPRYRPSPLSACFLPGSFDLENTKEDEEELDSDRPIAMIFSRRGARLEIPSTKSRACAFSRRFSASQASRSASSELIFFPPSELAAIHVPGLRGSAVCAQRRGAAFTRPAGGMWRRDGAKTAAADRDSVMKVRRRVRGQSQADFARDAVRAQVRGYLGLRPRGASGFKAGKRPTTEGGGGWSGEAPPPPPWRNSFLFLELRTVIRDSWFVIVPAAVR
ncbi:hypothetical protein DFH11DRAFT_1732180 [Phellopilus nigrolimitatus]|nr:hypothetical protein DFH11DRAFT_1732180 [Phellopilus nigrolimitatus]